MSQSSLGKMQKSVQRAGGNGRRQTYHRKLNRIHKLQKGTDPDSLLVYK